MNREDFAKSDPIEMARADLPPLLLELGLMLDLLEPVSGTEKVTLDVDWFADPWTRIKAIPKDRVPEMVAFLQTLLSSASGSSVGPPQQDASARLWYEIPLPAEASAVPLPIYIVTESVGDSGAQVLGLGVLHAFEFSPVVVTPSVFVPILMLPPGEDGPFVLGSDEHPIELSVLVAGESGGFGSGGVSFDGLNVGVRFYLDAVPGVDIILRNVKLPGLEPADMTLSDITSLPLQEWIATAGSLLIAQIAEVAGDAAATVESMGADLLDLLGLTGRLPALDWKTLTSDPKAALLDWIATIVGTPEIAVQWLQTVASLLAGDPPAEGLPEVTGSGSRANPWTIAVPRFSDAVDVQLTLAAVTDAYGAVTVYPGVVVGTSVLQPVSGVASLGTQIAARAELYAISITTSADRALALPDALLPSLEVTVGVRNPDASKNLFDVAAPMGSGNLSLKAIEMGLGVVSQADAGRGLSPVFLLRGVDTPAGAWDSIDLTNFQEIVNAVSEAITKIIQQAIASYFGDAAAEIAADVEAVLGVAKPPQVEGDWPVPLLTSDLSLLVSDPMAALGAYYTRSLTTDFQGKPALVAMLDSFAAALGGPASGGVTGSGTTGDPWRVPIVPSDAGKPTLALAVWDPGPSGDHALAFALDFVVPLAFAGVEANTAIRAQLLEVTLPGADGAGGSVGQWLAGVAVDLTIAGAPKDGKPTPLVTPALGGIAFSIDDALVAFGWSRERGLYAEGTLEQLKVLPSGAEPIVVGDLTLSTAETDWSKDVLAKLSQAAVDAVGAWLLGHGGRFGLAATALLGLLPGLETVLDGKTHDYPFEVPPGLALPTEGWPSLVVTDAATFWTDPWGDLKTQLGKLFATADNAVPMMRILGWAVTGDLLPAPDPTPSGSFEDPYRITFSNAWDLQLLAWTAEGGDALGFSVARVMSSHVSTSVEVDVTARLDLPPIRGLSGGAGGGDPLPKLPRGSILVDLENPEAGQPLVSISVLGIVIGHAAVGAVFDAAGVSPTLTLFDCTLPLQTEKTTYTLAVSDDGVSWTSPQGLPQMEALLFALGVSLATWAAQEQPLVADAIAVLESLDLFQMPDTRAALERLAAGESDDDSGVNSGGWLDLLADPWRFVRQQVRRVLADPIRRQSLLDAAAKLLGFESFALPERLAALPVVLSGLRLTRAVSGGYAIVLDSWVALARNPVGYLEDQGTALLSDPARLRELISALTQVVTGAQALPEGDGPTVTLTVSNDAIATLAVPADRALKLGPEIAVSGTLVLNLHDRLLTLDVVAGSESFQGALALALELRLDDQLQPTLDWGLQLQGFSPDLPAPFAPLRFWPLPEDNGAFLKRLGTELPAALLSFIGARALNTWVLPSHPMVQRLFEGLALTYREADTEPVQVRSFLGLLLHPVDWVLSPAVVGDGTGGVDFDKLGTLLSKLPGGPTLTGDAGVTVTAIDHGIAVTGLPYGSSVSLTSTAATGLAVGVAVKRTTGAPTLDVSGQLAYGADKGLAVSGDVTIGYDFGGSPPTSLAVTVGYDDGFSLSFSGAAAGSDFGPIALLPFGGFNQFLPKAPVTESATGGSGLFDWLLGQLVTAWQTYVGGTPNAKLVAFVTAAKGFAEGFGVKTPADLVATIEAIGTDPLAWLLSRFDAEHVVATLKSLHDFLKETLGFDAVTLEDDGKQLAWKAAESDGIGSLTLALGLRKMQGEDVFGVWLEPEVAIQFFKAGVAAGAGIVPSGATKGELRFLLTGSAGVDLTSFQLPAVAAGPELSLELDADPSGIKGFELFLYPVGPGTTADTLVVELLPKPALTYGDDPTKPVDATAWLFKLLTQIVAPLVGNMILSTDQVTTWLNAAIGSSTVTSGAILAAFGLIEPKKAEAGDDPIAYELVDLSTLAGKTPQEFLLTALEAFLASSGEFQVLKLSNGGVWIVSETSGNATDFGVRLQLQDLRVLGEDASKATDPGSSTSKDLLVQLGKYITGDTDDDNWITRSRNSWTGPKPGLVVFFVKKDGETITFHGKVDLISVGVDFKGGDKQPLVDIAGVQLGGVEPRALVSIEVTDTSSAIFGGVVRLDEAALPLGPSLSDSNASDNPVAQSLLAGKSNPTDSSVEVVNPTFGISAAYSELVDVQLYGDPADPGKATGKLWFLIQRALGPLYARKIGIGWQGAKATPPYLLSLLFDGSVSLAGLSVDLVELSVGIPVTTPTEFENYRLGLRGLDVTFQGGPVLIGGAFLEQDRSPQPPEYLGVATIEAAGFGLTAIGGYAAIETASGNQPSLFIFANLSAPLGGPPYFFVTGVAAGFGFNRDLILPPLDGVGEWPLVKGSTDPTIFGKGNLEDAMKALGDSVKPRLGNYWLAAGLHFTTFELLDSFGLLTVSFGRRYEIALLGLSTLSLPKAGTGIPPYLYVELSIQVVIDLSDGVFRVSAVLSPNSYVLDEDVHLTGGFAFYVWFPPLDPDADDHTGDAVFTVGGYHPLFQKPAWYPEVPRVGFNWRKGDVSISGGGYFALTPSAVMAGGNLDANYQSGGLRAWFNAYADFLIQWKPFHYDIAIGVSVGASYTVKVIVTKTFKVELGAQVHIQGPPMVGRARVTWWVISFTVHFGDDSATDEKLLKKWDDFADYFLPGPGQDRMAAAATRRLDLGLEVDDHQVVKVVFESGLLADQTQDTGETTEPPKVNPDRFAMRIDSAVPATEVSFGGDSPPQSWTGPEVGCKPMGSLDLVSQQNLTLYTVEQTGDGEKLIPQPLGGWNLDKGIGDVPAALWDTRNPGYVEPSAKLLKDRLIGVGKANPKAQERHGPPAFPLAIALAPYALPCKHLPLTDKARQVTGGGADRSSLEVIEETAMDPAVVDLRADLRVAIGDLGVQVTDGSLSMLAAYAEATFQAEPMLGPLGSPGDPSGDDPPPGLRADLVVSGPARAAVIERAGAGSEPVLLAAWRSREGLRGRRLRSVATVAIQDVLTRRTERSVLAGASDADGAVHVRPGDCSLWQLPARGRRVVTVDGVADVVAVDASERILGWWRDQRGEVRLPDDTVWVALFSQAPNERGDTIGWDRSTDLLALGPNVLVGRDVLVRAQTPMPSRRGVRLQDHGVVSGARLVDANIVGEDRASGWVETRLPGCVTHVEVRLEREPGCDAPDAAQAAPRMLYTSGTGTFRRNPYRPLEPTSELTDARRWTLQLELPPTDGDHAVRVWAPPGTRLAAVYGQVPQAQARPAGSTALAHIA